MDKATIVYVYYVQKTIKIEKSKSKLFLLSIKKKKNHKNKDIYIRFYSIDIK